MSNPIKCRSCGALIAFLVTPKGHRMPVDAELKRADSDDPEMTVVTPGGQTKKGVEANEIYYVPHWSTCKDPKRFRRRDT